MYDQFIKCLDVDFIKLVTQVNAFGFKVGVIGGTTRNFFNNVPINHDYDCELRLVDNTKDIMKHFNSLISELKKKYKVEKLNLNVHRIKYNNFECELTLPRLEAFTSEFNHTNFKVQFVEDEQYQCFSRRDFTINTIMLEYNNDKWSLIDPLDGLAALKKKNLLPCSIFFEKDPVRFLRAVRFEIKYNFKICNSILLKFSEIDLTKFSSHYLSYEAKKSSHILYFLLRVYELSLGGQRSVYIDSIKKYNPNVETNISKIINQHFYIENKIRLSLAKQLSLNLKHLVLDQKQYVFKSFSKFNLESLKENPNTDKYIYLLKFLLSSQFSFVDYLFKINIIDINSDSIEKILNLNVCFDDIAPNLRKYYLFKKQLSYVN